MAEKTPPFKSAIILYSDKVPSSFREVRDQLAKTPDTEVHTANGIRECIEKLNQSGRGIVLFSISKKEELVEILTLLVNQQAMIRGNLLRVLGCNQLDPDVVNPVLMKKGCSDILPASAPAKAVLFKINRWLKLIETTYEKSATETLSENHTEKHTRAREIETQRGPEVIWAEPLVNVSLDVWLRGKKAPRFVMGKWIVELIGPAPTEGRWEADNKNWSWTSLKKEGPFFDPSGKWTFVGRQPEFDSQNLIWQFISDKPDLSWYSPEKGKVGTRFSCDAQGRLVIRNDSPTALTLAPLIEESLQFQYKIKSSAKAADGNSYVFQDGAQKPAWNQELTKDQKAFSDFTDTAEEEAPAEWNLDYDSIGASIKIHRKSGEDQPASFKDFFDDKIILESPWQGPRGEDVAITIRTEYTTPQLNFKLNGTIDSAEQDKEKFCLTLTLKDHEHPLLQQFNKLISTRQTSILNFFKAAKGF